MKYLSIAVLLFAVAILTRSAYIQDHVIQQQRQLIKEMATNPSCLIPLHITEN